MNRWLVKTNDKSLRYPTFKWYAPTIQEVQNQFPEAEITQDFDKSYLEYIEKIKEKSEYDMLYDNKGREAYTFRLPKLCMLFVYANLIYTSLLS